MLKEKDFVEIEYTGILEENNRIFDTTDESLAKKEKIYNSKTKYGPIIICIGENQILKGLDEELIGKELGKSYTFNLNPEKAFGSKNAKLMQLVSQSSFKSQKIIPYPGLQINIDGLLGVVRTVTSGRVIVDFNHPLAGKKLVYKIKILKKISDPKEQLDSFMAFVIRDFKTEIKDGEAVIISKSLPKEIAKNLEEKITSLIPTIKKLAIKKE